MDGETCRTTSSWSAPGPLSRLQHRSGDAELPERGCLAHANIRDRDVIRPSRAVADMI